MSLYSAMIAGVSGLKAQASALATVSDNISNVNTTGYKRNTTTFSSIVTGTGSLSTYSAGGVRGSTAQLISQQGVLQASQSATDVAVQGSGFFVVNTLPGGVTGGGNQLYTRAGSFSEDNQGFLRNAAGYYLQGWRLDQNGNVLDANTVETVALGTINGVAVDSTRITLKANLRAGETPDSVAVAGDFDATPTWATLNDIALGLSGTDPEADRSFDVQVYDSLGAPHNLHMRVTRIGAAASNTWGFVMSANAGDIDPAQMPAGPAGAEFTVAYGTLTFGGAGELTGTTMYSSDPTGAAWVDVSATNQLSIAWANGANRSNVELFTGTAGKTDGLTQFEGDYVNYAVDANGAPVGQRNGVYIDEAGYVVVTFSNGASRPIFQLPVATFADPNSLIAKDGNAFLQTTGSGEANLRAASTGGAGAIAPQALEGSNVDLGQEFTEMIIIQRAYAANAKTITTADEMLDELMRIKR